MKKIAKLLAVMMLVPACGFAQAVKANYDTKVIETDSLNLPKNTDLSTLLDLLPELLQRPGDFMFSNYDVQIEGMSVGSASDVALMQLQIVDVRQIVVSESPVSSYNNNGQGGSINILLRSEGKNNASYWGSAGVTVGYPLDAAPQMNVGYKNDKFMVRGMLFGEVYNVTNDFETIEYVDGKFSQSNGFSSEEHFLTQLARAYMKFTPNDKNEFNLNVSGIFTSDKMTSKFEHNTETFSEEKTRTTNLTAQFKYQHKFKRSSLLAETQYVYTPGMNIYDELSSVRYDDEYHSHNISGKVEFKTPLLPVAASLKPMPSALSLAVGSNFNGMIRPDALDCIRIPDMEDRTLNSDTKTWYAMPYAMLEGTFGKFQFKAIGEYQFYEYKLNFLEDPYTGTRSDFTGKLMTEWHFSPHKNLRLIFKRNIERPTGEQLYPYRYYNPRLTGYVKGNRDLTPMMSNEITLDYIADYKWRQNHSIVFNAGISYNNVSDIIKSYYQTGNLNSEGMLGTSLPYWTFMNQGTNHILSANLMALYTYKAFSLSFTGNVFHNDRTDEDTDMHHYTYCNLSVYPHFNLQDGWSGGIKLTYYSKVDQKDIKLSDCTLTHMTVGKSWDNFFAYVFQNIALQRHAEDTIAGPDNTSQIYSYIMTPNTVGVGFKYTF